MPKATKEFLVFFNFLNFPLVGYIGSILKNHSTYSKISRLPKAISKKPCTILNHLMYVKPSFFLIIPIKF